MDPSRKQNEHSYVCICKKGGETDCSNYWAILHLSTAHKILCNIRHVDGII